MVFRKGKQDKQINDFLLFRKEAKNIMKKIYTKKDEMPIDF
jgi:hypothetical protein